MSWRELIAVRPVPPGRSDWWIAVALLAAGMVASLSAAMLLRQSGRQPSFYQETFGPAVMFACGHGLVATKLADEPSPLRDFLHLRQASFSCGELPSPVPTRRVDDSSWLYLHAVTGLLWRVTGISWAAIDYLSMLLGGLTIAVLYGLFRFVASRPLAAVAAFVAMPVHFSYLLHVRDYSKAPMVLAALLILMALLVLPMRSRTVVGLAALFGAVVGIGYGFRTDLMVMMPLGIVVAAALLPGGWWRQRWRNAGAVAAMCAAFGTAAAPVMSGAPENGCASNFLLLGLTSPLSQDLGMRPGVYSWGDTFSDTFVDLKVGDYAHRMLGSAPPALCQAEYEAAADQLFVQLARTFPADLVARAYASVIAILSSGLVIGAVGPIIAVAATIAAWMMSPRLGVGLAICILFLGGYPAIEFQARHWFHLRFIPVWMSLLVAGQAWWFWRNGWPRLTLIRSTMSVALGLIAMVVVLAGIRQWQGSRVTALMAAYEASAAEPLPVRRDGTRADVDWRGVDYGSPPNHRSSELLKVVVQADGCPGAGDITIDVRYDVNLPTHNLPSRFVVGRPAAGAPTHLYVPVFLQGFEDTTYLRFAGFDVPAASAACIGSVHRVTERAREPLWLAMQVAAGGTISAGLHQGIGTRWSW